MRKRRELQYNYGGSWAKKQSEKLLKADPVMLEEIRSIKNGYGGKIKLRIEEPWVQFYAHDEQTLKDIATRLNYSNSSTITERFMSISTPENPEQQVLLEAGNIIAAPNSKQEHKYKLVLRDGVYNKDAKLQVASYLRTLGDDVKVTPANLQMLEGPLHYMWGCFVYTNDPSITTMIGLIAPGMVGKIHEIVKL